MSITKIAVIGSRSYSNYEQFKIIMKKLIDSLNSDIVLVSGGANGADSLVAKYADEFNIPIEVYLPDWSKGKGAGFKRNYDIWNHSDIGIAFWDGYSKGTAHSFSISRQQKKNLYVFNYTTNKWFKEF